MIKFFDRISRLIPCIHVSFLTALALFCLSISSQAAEPVEKIIINADRMNLNMESGVSVYTGNVRISQGELVLSGDKVTLKQNKENEVEHITVVGKPARYNHITEKGEPIEAESEHMVYNASQNKLIMTINARLQQPDHQLSSQKIIYNTLKRIIIAGGSDTPPDKSIPETGTSDKSKESQRVNITLTPKKPLQPREKSAAE